MLAPLVPRLGTCIHLKGIAGLKIPARLQLTGVSSVVGAAPQAGCIHRGLKMVFFKLILCWFFFLIKKNYGDM